MVDIVNKLEVNEKFFCIKSYKESKFQNQIKLFKYLFIDSQKKKKVFIYLEYQISKCRQKLVYEFHLNIGSCVQQKVPTGHKQLLNCCNCCTVGSYVLTKMPKTITELLYSRRCPQATDPSVAGHILLNCYISLNTSF